MWVWTESKPVKKLLRKRIFYLVKRLSTTFQLPSAFSQHLWLWDLNSSCTQLLLGRHKTSQESGPGKVADVCRRRRVWDKTPTVIPQLCEKKKLISPIMLKFKIFKANWSWWRASDVHSLSGQKWFYVSEGEGLWFKYMSGSYTGAKSTSSSL